MSKSLLSLILPASALWQLTAAGPVDPTITQAAVLPRQYQYNSPDFMGLLYDSSARTYEVQTCEPGARWYKGSDGQHAQCCASSVSPCYPAIDCYGGSMVYTYPSASRGLTVACTEDFQNTAYSVCNTAYIFENSQADNPRTNFFCGPGPRELLWTLYRSVSTTETSLTSTSPTISTTTPAGSIPAAEPKTSSKAWIAGVVVGPLLGLALVAAGVLLCLRRKKKKNAQAPQHGVAAMAPVNPSQPPTGVTGYTDAKPQFQPAQSTYYNSQQEQAYPQQGAFSPPQVSPPMSPAPQYAYQAPYNTSSGPPNAPYTQDVKHAAHGGAAELGGSNLIAPATSVPQGAELGGQNEKTGR